MVSQAFNSNIHKAEGSSSLSLSVSQRLVCSTLEVPGQLGLHRETLSLKNQQQKKQSVLKQFAYTRHGPTYLL